MDFTTQLTRIKNKLAEASKKDAAHKVFGADSHQYQMGSPASVEEVREFEKSHGIRLPVEYVAFITAIGNGGPGHFGCAGPHYGIYPLGNFGFMLIDADSMAAPCRITSTLTRNEWEEMTAFDDELDSDSAEYDVKYKELFEGLMTIGTQGCNAQTMIALNGPDKGRIVYIDQDLAQPGITADANFLDWYEAWLDRILK